MMTLKERAALLGVSYSTMRRMSGGNIQRKYTEKDKQLVLALLKEGLSLQEVSNRTTVPKSTVRYWKEQQA